MPKVNEEKNLGVPSGQPLKDKLSDAAPSFTPGPWEVDTKLRQGTDGGRYAYLEVAAVESALWLARVQSFSDSNGKHLANARLIAAAPELYEALVALLPYLSTEVQLLDYASLNDGRASSFDTASVKARAALAKVNAPKQEK